MITLNFTLPNVLCQLPGSDKFTSSAKWWQQFHPSPLLTFIHWSPVTSLLHMVALWHSFFLFFFLHIFLLPLLWLPAPHSWASVTTEGIKNTLMIRANLMVIKFKFLMRSCWIYFLLLWQWLCKLRHVTYMPTDSYLSMGAHFLMRYCKAQHVTWAQVQRIN